MELANSSEMPYLCWAWGLWLGTSIEASGAIHPTAALLSPSCPDSRSAQRSVQMPQPGIQALG